MALEWPASCSKLLTETCYYPRVPVAGINFPTMADGTSEANGFGCGQWVPGIVCRQH